MQHIDYYFQVIGQILKIRSLFI